MTPRWMSSLLARLVRLLRLDAVPRVSPSSLLASQQAMGRKHCLPIVAISHMRLRNGARLVAQPGVPSTFAPQCGRVFRGAATL